MNPLRLLVFLAAVPVFSHPLYLLPQKFQVQPGEKVLLSVHNGDSFPAGEDAVDPVRLLNIKIGAGGSYEEFRRLGKATHGFVSIPAPGTHVVSLQTDPKMIDLAPDKFESYLKEEGLEHAIGWRAKNGESDKPGKERYSKYAKTLLVAGAPDSGYRTPSGAVVEVIPQADPFALKPGESLPVQVVWRGKPAAGLMVHLAWVSPGSKPGYSRAGRTDASGRPSIPIAAPGRWRVYVVAMERCAEPAVADWESFWGSLTFELP